MSFNFNEFLSSNNITIKRQVTSYKTLAAEYLKNNAAAVVTYNKHNSTRGDKLGIYSLNGDKLQYNEYNKNNAAVIIAALKNNNITVTDIKTLLK